ncbi:MAG TPA: PPOX class F420-dependent oxidoreductase, partial [Micromonosporaceae bacterium]
MSIPAEIARAKYVSLTTFRRNGTPVTTPVWAAANGDELFIVSDLDAGKVKRIRNSGRVTLVPCTIRGKVAPDAKPVEGTARLLDDADTAECRRVIARKYVLSRVGNWFARVFHLRKP